MTRQDPMVHPGALKQAIRVLRWWTRALVTPITIQALNEAFLQSREAARALERDLVKWEAKLHRDVAREQQAKKRRARARRRA